MLCDTSCDTIALQAAKLCVPITWHTSSVGVPGYSWFFPPGSGVLCDASCDTIALQAERHVRHLSYVDG